MSLNVVYFEDAIPKLRFVLKMLAIKFFEEADSNKRYALKVLKGLA